MRIIRHADLVTKPWSNGGGVTRDIAARTLDGALLWRLSIADVDVDGPFSDFTGLTRVLTVIEGGGLILHNADGDTLADYASPVTFDGGTPIHAELSQGPLRDFNLMYDSARCDGEARVAHGPLTSDFGAWDETVVIHCIAGMVVLGDAERLAKGDTAIVSDAPVSLALGRGDIALCIGLRVRS